jgi:DNA-directed RNA polymerase specialized sigma24 family protein
MRTTTLPITAASFEKVFMRTSGTRETRLQTYSSTDEYRAADEMYQDAVGWHRIARKAIEKDELAGALQRAIISLPVQYREVLFLRDVKNLDADETAWILRITTGAVRARLRRARMQVTDALSSSFTGAGETSSATISYWIFRRMEPESVASRR